MDDISNRTLALFLVTAIIVSLGATIYSLNRFTTMGISATGKATETGKVNLSVQNSISILLLTSVVDFGTGYVNVSCSEILTGGKNFSNLTAAATFTDNTDCWTGSTLPNGFVVENNGNVNVSIAVRGPTLASFFNSYSGPYKYNLTVIARSNETNSCADGLVSWPTYAPREISSNATLCGRLKFYPDSSDTLAVDVNILVPLDLSSGTYENSSIEFYAAQV